MKICVVGGGSTYTPELIEGFIRIEKDVNLTEVVLLDIKDGEKKLDILTNFSQRILKKQKSNIKLSSTLDAEKAIGNADIVINQFRAGCLPGRIRDEKIPLAFGLLGQETTGMGGMSNGIRAIPIIEKYTKLIKEISNNAWIINFTNPSGMLTEYIKNYLGYERCIGLCNVPIEYIVQLSEIYKCNHDEIFLKYYGLNHLSFIDDVWIKGKKRSDELWDNFEVNMKNIPDVEYEKTFPPAMGHLFNGYLKYFYNTPFMLKAERDECNREGTRGEQVQQIEKKLLELYSEADRDTPPEELSQRGGFMYSTVATELIRDLVVGSGKIHIINTPNNGALSNMPDDYIMEIPAKITKNGPKPVSMKEASKLSLGLIHTIKSYDRLVIEGCINKDENMIKQAMMVHPLGPSEPDLEPLWNRLKTANADYYPKF
jgi:6-phospho-beta-glucosidase